MPGTFVLKADHYNALKSPHEFNHLPLPRVAG